MFVLFCRWNDKIAKPMQCNTCFIAEVNPVVSAETSRSLHNVLGVVWDFNLKFSSHSQVSKWQTDTLTNKHSYLGVILDYLVHTSKHWVCDVGPDMCSFPQVLDLSRNLPQLWLALNWGSCFYDIKPYFSFHLTHSSQGYRQS